MPDAERRGVMRVMPREVATTLVGVPVQKRVPNVTDPTFVTDMDTGHPILVYVPLPDMSEFRRQILAVDHFGVTRRSATGLINRSRTFGASPRFPTRSREACFLSTIARDQPDVNGYLAQYAERLADVLADYVPDILAADRTTMEQVLPEWRLTEKALWTSGVINRSSQLPYHRDGANFDAWSAMPVVRRGIRGGHLHIPEYDLTVECRDGYGVFFNGYTYVHGVTPLKAITDDAYRFSVVYYALRGMKDCHTFAEETARGRRNRTAREKPR